jgi:hypothetical protein
MGRKRMNLRCPVCSELGAGPYKRWVKNSQKVRYEPYFYFKHIVEERKGDQIIKKVKWCYLTHELAEDCARERAKKLEKQATQPV